MIAIDINRIMLEKFSQFKSENSYDSISRLSLLQTKFFFFFFFLECVTYFQKICHIEGMIKLVN